MESSIIWLMKLVLAHFISDFWWQPSKWVKDKEKNKINSGYLYLKVVLAITIIHGIIDLLKSYAKSDFKNFAIDQILHLVVIVASWVVTFNYQPNIKMLQTFYESSRFWAFAAGVFFLTFPASVIIAYVTKQWDVPAGLKNAGKYIGIIERILICLFVYNGQYEAIGLLITAKSILRYNSNNEEVKTEYLLIGTLLSIFIAVAIGLTLKLIVK
jgi:hypothetical protein